VEFGLNAVLSHNLLLIGSHRIYSIIFLASRAKADGNDYKYHKHNARATDDKRLCNAIV